jgi:hypothetical protein
VAVKWLKQPYVTANLTGNPWKCECSALGEAWRELRHKLTVNCASAEDRRGRTWDVIKEDLCPKLSAPDYPLTETSVMNLSSNVESEGAEVISDSDNGNSSLMTTILIVIGVFSVCVLIAGGIILVLLLKKLRGSSNAPQNSNVYTQWTTYVQDPTVSPTYLITNMDCAQENIYETVA